MHCISNWHIKKFVTVIQDIQELTASLQYQ